MMPVDKNAISIRPMVYNDVDPVLSIWWANIPTKEMIASQIGGPLDMSFIAELHGQLVGFLLGRLVYMGLPMARVCLIHFIAIKPENQAQGVGTLLMQTLQNQCKSKSIQTIRALVPSNDSKTMEYFNYSGFRTSNIVNLDKPV